MGNSEITASYAAIRKFMVPLLIGFSLQSLTNYIEQGPFSTSNNWLDRQEIPRHLWNLNAYYRVPSEYYKLLLWAK